MKKSIVILLASFLAVATGCHKKDNPTPTPVTTADSGTLYFHLHTNLDTNEADEGITYTCSDGRKISMSEAKLYLSNIVLIKKDGTALTIPNVIIHKTVDVEEYFVAKVPVGDYKAVKFGVGLDPATNLLTATADSTLNDPDMWFGSAAQPGGYAFIDFDGTIDTTTNPTGSAVHMEPFMIKLGTNAHYTTVTMPDHDTYSLTKGNSITVHIIVDYYKLFNGITLNNPMNLMVHTAADNANANATKMAGNISSMFSYEE